MKIEPAAWAWGATVGLAGVVLVAAYFAVGPSKPEPPLTRITTPEGWTETKEYIETPSGKTRIYKLYDDTGTLVFIAEGPTGQVGVAVRPIPTEPVKPDPDEAWSR